MTPPPRQPHKYRPHKGKKCERCGFVPKHQGQLDIHHRDGDYTNNEVSNLETVCANCHRLESFTGPQFGDPKTAVLHMRISDGEKGELRRRADSAGLTLSAYIRSVLLPPDSSDLVDRAVQRAGKVKDRALIDKRVLELSRTLPKATAKRIAAREALEEARR